MIGLVTHSVFASSHWETGESAAGNQSLCWEYCLSFSPGVGWDYKLNGIYSLTFDPYLRFKRR